MSKRTFERYQYRQILVRLRQGDTDRQIARARLMGRRKLAVVTGSLVGSFLNSPAFNNLNDPGKIILAALAGGTVSYAAGGNFGNGALAAAFVEAFNDLEHSVKTLNLRIKRFEQTSESTIGRLYANGKLLGYTLEPPGPDSTVQGSDRRILAGMYRAVRYYSATNHGEVLKLLGVPGRTYIEIHAGDFPSNTHGCILPGRNYYQNRVHPSGPIVKEIMSDALNAQQIEVKITDPKKWQP